MNSSNSALLYANDGNFISSNKNHYLNYWLGNVDSNVSVKSVVGTYTYINGVNFDDSAYCGVRPVVTISKSLVTKITN